MTGEQFESTWVEKLFHEANTVRLKETVWHVTLFMLYPPLGHATNAMIVLAIIINVLLQISFTFLVVFYISGSGEDLEALQKDFGIWRELNEHNTAAL
eukprot:CAMPEP_0194538144 /NCGR_PEP_ID=MMETSP0253-20130528/77598_1 /TAXON_ID=2966 /ORGANISM="Noctiluca scintillans" /LENGTH=97 /DNA_ID=CAMNT_0039384221 /DNA_START=192 /DNA_END=481 /DNA_ORIENTATION=+